MIERRRSLASRGGRFTLSFALTAVGAGGVPLPRSSSRSIPTGRAPRPGAPAAPIMDLNQRFMYPQIVRSGRFDAAVFGTSTVRLLDPALLDARFGGALRQSRAQRRHALGADAARGPLPAARAAAEGADLRPRHDLVRGGRGREAADLPRLSALALRRQPAQRLCRTCSISRRSRSPGASPSIVSG